MISGFHVEVRLYAVAPEERDVYSRVAKIRLSLRRSEMFRENIAHLRRAEL
jgi:hypothetical protein